MFLIPLDFQTLTHRALVQTVYLDKKKSISFYRESPRVRCVGKNLVFSIRKNRLLISSAIRLDIHMVIYLTSNGRFTAEDQKSLKMINDWTAGQIWDHLVVVQVLSLINALECLLKIAKL